MPSFGSPCILRANRWEGEPPDAGDFLRTVTGTSYLIDRVRPRPSGRYVLDVIRWNPGLIPPGATVHEWNWDRR